MAEDRLAAPVCRSLLLGMGIALSGIGSTLCVTSASADDVSPPLRDAENGNADDSGDSSLAFPVVGTNAPAAQQDPFPRYPSLAPSVQFWTHVFRDYSEDQSIVQSALYPQKVLRVLDFHAQAQRLDKAQFAKYRAKAEDRARDEMEALIREVASKQHAPQTMDEDERRLYALFQDVHDDQVFKHLRGSIRTQRGLKERTQDALRVSSRYLPYMESIFSDYGLPKQLTRLPLVESSFNLDAYSKSGAAGIWQFIPSSARVYMRLNAVVDDRRDPWTSTDAAARHLKDDYEMLDDWPLAITAYNHGRNGIARALKSVDGHSLVDLIQHYDSPRFGFAGKNYYAEFLAAVDVERAWQEQHDAEEAAAHNPLKFEVVETKNYVPYETLRRLCGANDELFRRLNPAYRPEVIDGQLYVPPGHLIRVPAGSAREFEVGYAKLGKDEVFDRQRVYFLLHRVRSGDTLIGLANRYKVSVASIRQANELRSSFIRSGQVLKITPHEEARPGPIRVAVGESKPTLTRSQIQAAESGARTHRVVRGDTLSTIAHRYRISVASLRSANGLRSSNIRAGQVLTIPAREEAALEHRVVEGDTLSTIAHRYRVSQASVRTANDLDSSTIRVGQVLAIPGGHTILHTRTHRIAYHRVRRGQTLGGIAERYDISLADLRRANRLGSSSDIQVGQQLRIPLSH